MKAVVTPAKKRGHTLSCPETEIRKNCGNHWFSTALPGTFDCTSRHTLTQKTALPGTFDCTSRHAYRNKIFCRIFFRIFQDLVPPRAVDNSSKRTADHPIGWSNVSRDGEPASSPRSAPGILPPVTAPCW